MNSRSASSGEKSTQRWLMTNYPLTTSASLYEKADALDRLAETAAAPGHADVFRRAAQANRVVAALAKIAETPD
jgi:hypothetical protein